MLCGVPCYPRAEPERGDISVTVRRMASRTVPVQFGTHLVSGAFGAAIGLPSARGWPGPPFGPGLRPPSARIGLPPFWKMPSLSLSSLLSRGQHDPAFRCHHHRRRTGRAATGRAARYSSCHGRLRHRPLVVKGATEHAISTDQDRPRFVATMHEEEGGGAIVRAMLTVAATMKLEVVAEGVETQAQFETLRTSAANICRASNWRGRRLRSGPATIYGAARPIAERQ